MNRTPNLKAPDRIFLALVGVLILSLIYSTAFSQPPPSENSYTNQKVVNEAQAQVQGFNSIQAERKFVVTELFVGTDSGRWKNLVTKAIYVTDGDKSTIQSPGDTARLYFSTTGRPLVGSVTWKYADQRYDTTWTVKEIYDDAAGSPGKFTNLVNIGKATGQTKPGLYNKTFTAVSVVSSVSSWKTTCVCDRIEFFGETWQGHGWVKFLIDGDQVAMQFKGNAPYHTDYSIMRPSFYWVFPKATPTSAPGTHTLEVKTDPGNQYITDMIRTLTYTLKPR